MMIMAVYPKELRERVVAAAEQVEYTIAEIANMFSVGVTFVNKMLKLHRECEDLAPRHGGGPVRLLGKKELALLRS
jgi:transposase